MLEFLGTDDHGDMFQCTGCHDTVWISDMLYEIGLVPDIYLLHILCDGDEIDIVSGTIVPV